MAVAEPAARACGVFVAHGQISANGIFDAKGSTEQSKRRSQSQMPLTASLLAASQPDHMHACSAHAEVAGTQKEIKAAAKHANKQAEGQSRIPGTPRGCFATVLNKIYCCYLQGTALSLPPRSAAYGCCQHALNAKPRRPAANTTTMPSHASPHVRPCGPREGKDCTKSATATLTPCALTQARGPLRLHKHQRPPCAAHKWVDGWMRPSDQIRSDEAKRPARQRRRSSCAVLGKTKANVRAVARPHDAAQLNPAFL